MEHIKLIKDNEGYRIEFASDSKMRLLGYFLISEIGPDISFYKNWLLDKTTDETEGNYCILEKSNNEVILGSAYSKPGHETYLIIKIQELIKALDMWQKIYISKPSEILIVYENNSFVIKPEL